MGYIVYISSKEKERRRRGGGEEEEKEEEKGLCYLYSIKFTKVRL